MSAEEAERCMAWLRERVTGGLKRETLWQDARAAMPEISTRDFDIAYRLVFRRKRGRPKKTVDFAALTLRQGLGR
jgi:hypothetical protein